MTQSGTAGASTSIALSPDGPVLSGGKTRFMETITAAQEIERLCNLSKERELTRPERDLAIRIALNDPAQFDRVFEEIIFGPSE